MQSHGSFEVEEEGRRVGGGGCVGGRDTNYRKHKEMQHCWLQRWRKGSQSQETCQHLEAKKGKETFSSRASRKANSRLTP